MENCSQPFFISLRTILSDNSVSSFLYIYRGDRVPLSADHMILYHLDRNTLNFEEKLSIMCGILAWFLVEQICNEIPTTLILKTSAAIVGNFRSVKWTNRKRPTYYLHAAEHLKSLPYYIILYVQLIHNCILEAF